MLRHMRWFALLLVLCIGNLSAQQQPTLASAVQSHPALRDLAAADRSALTREGNISLNHRDVDDIRLAPDLPGISDALRTIDRSRANILSERLMVMPGSYTRADLLEVYNAVTATSELAYIQYYNPEKDVYHDLFRESHEVASGDDLSPLPDRDFSRIPILEEKLVLQELPPFGEVLQRYTYEQVDGRSMDGFLLNSTNLWDIRYNNIRVVRPEDMITYAWIIRTDQALLLYGLGSADVFTAFGLFRDRIETSFSSRTDGLFDWLKREHLDRLVAR